MPWKNDCPIPYRSNYPLLFDRERKPKPALEAVLRVPRERHTALQLNIVPTDQRHAAPGSYLQPVASGKVARSMR